MVIDFTALMAPIGLGGLTLLAATVAGIGSCIDDRERERMRVRAMQVGAWWLSRTSSRAVAPHLMA
jgi:hypothetical protein